MKIVEVIPNQLYFSGSVDDWNAVSSFSSIVNMEIEEMDKPPYPNQWSGKILAWIPIPDYNTSVESMAPDLNWLDRAVNLTSSLMSHGGKVLVHCQMGENRSGLVVTATLMKLNHLTCDQALAQVRIGKPTAVWNPVWVNKLKAYEVMLLGGSV